MFSREAKKQIREIFFFFWGGGGGGGSAFSTFFEDFNLVDIWEVYFDCTEGLRTCFLGLF